MPSRRITRELVRCAAFALVAGCTARDDARPGDSAAGAAAAVAAAPDSSAAAGPGCRLSGLWEPCSVEDRMTHAGLVIARKAEAARHDFLAIPGIAYGVGAGDDVVEVFVYASESARRLDTDRLDSLAVSPKGDRRSYKVPPMLVTSNNLAALVFTRNERSQERIALALSAGLPQPGR